MNKDQRKGFFTGLLAAAVLLGVGGAAVAAGRTIEVTDGMAVTVNGVPFTPKDANGKEVALFAYEGTTYAPIRAFSKAAGLLVEYDSETQTAQITTPDYVAQYDPSAADYITPEKAKELALADAKVDAKDAVFLKATLDWENGKAVYEVEFCAGTTEYDYELDAVTGAVLNKDLDLDDFTWASAGRVHIPAQSAPGGLISLDQAKKAALAKAGDPKEFTFTKEKLEQDDGQWVYELELRAADGTEYEFEVNAQTGEILSWDVDKDDLDDKDDLNDKDDLDDRDDLDDKDDLDDMDDLDD